MERKIKKEISLNRFFMIFLAHALLSLLCVGALWVCLLFASTYFQVVTPANAVERSVSDWRKSLDSHGVVTPDEIPAGAEYAIFDVRGLLLQTNLSEDALQSAADLAASHDSVNIRRSGPIIGSRIYLRADTDTQCVIVAYRLVSSFTSPLLRRFLPNAELAFFLMLLFLLIADFIFIALHYARKLKKELQKLAAATGQIGRQNLDFDMEKTRLAEFNKIMDSLEHLKTDLQRSLKEQWAMEQQKKRRLAALTHDIKTPLAIITGNAELLLETNQTKEQREYTTFILEHTNQIHRYVTGILELSRPIETLSDHTCALGELLSSAAKMGESLGKSKNLSVTLSAKDLPGHLLVPAEKLERILTNLIDNAVQYSPEGGTVYLSACIKENRLEISVRDEGKGFSGEALSFATDEFYCSDESRNSKEHFGLGLAIARRIAEGLGGTIRLENAKGKGALVTVCFPLDEMNQNLGY